MNMQLRKSYAVMLLGVLMATAGCRRADDGESSSARVKRSVASIALDESIYPVVVIGGGIGGMTASIYTAMANMKTVLLQGPIAGGLLTQSLSVRNWPSEHDATGEVITEKIRAQAAARGVEVAAETVVGVNFNTWPYTIDVVDNLESSKTRTIKALTVIVGMGAESRYLGIPGEKEYWSKGVTNCAVCEGSLYKDKTVCVVGAGNSAMEEASYLAGLAKKVYVFVRRNELRAQDNRKDEVLALANVEFVYTSELRTINGDGTKVTSIDVENTTTHTMKNYQMDGVFLAIGFTPNTKLFKNQLQLTDAGYIALVHDQETSVPGVYAVGDIVDPVYKQAVTAAGDGCRAALQACDALRECGYRPLAKQAVKEVALQKTATPVQPVASQAADVSFNGEVRELMSMDEYHALLKANKPVVIDFHATWCGPCKRIAPLYKKIAEEYGDKVLFAKLNIDHLGEVAQASRIQGVPTFVFLKQGVEKGRLVGGGYQRENFVEIVDSLLK